MQKLIQKMQSKKARIGVIGLGYAGPPLVIRFCQGGFTVIGFDVDPDKVAAINDGRSYIQHITGAQLVVDARNAIKNQKKFAGKIVAA
jgi:UDP-N-acetyl-D-glucosamine dehydrogenase